MRVPIVLFVALATQLIDTASPRSAQIPTGLTFTLATKDSRTVFRMGEPIDLELRFSSSTPGRYEVHGLATRRTNRFFSDPADGAVDPFADFLGIGEGPGSGAHALSLFETREAALEIVRVYRRELPAEVRAWLQLGLRRSPYRQDVIAAMEKDLEAPDMPVTSYWIGTLTDLAAVAASPRSPDFARSYNYYYDRLAAVSERKIGHAREVTLTTLAIRYRRIC